MDPQSSLGKILGRLLEREGGPVTPEELFRLHDATTGTGSLSDEERMHLLDRVATDPVAAGRLRALMRFPEASEPLADDGLEERWSTFREQLPSVAREPAGMGRTYIRPWLLAASFVLCGGLTFWAGRFVLPAGSGDPETVQAWANPEIVELASVDASTSAVRSGRIVRLSAAVQALVVVLDVPNADSNEPLLLEVVDADSKTVVRSPGYLPSPAGSFSVVLPTGSLESGPYRLELLGPDGELRHLFLIELVVARED